MPASLMDMLSGQAPLAFSPRDYAGNQIGMGDAIAQNSNSLVGLGMGLLSPYRSGESPYANALQGFQAGSVADANRGYRQAQLAHQKAQDARQAAQFGAQQARQAREDAYRREQDALSRDLQERQFARSGESSFAKIARDLDLKPGTPEYADQARKYVQSQMEGEWETRDIIDPSDPDGERKISVQQNKRTGQYRRPELPGTAAAPPDPFTAGAGQPVYGAGGNFSATPGAAPAQPGSRRMAPIQGAGGITYQPPAGLSKEGRKAWENHVAGTEAKIAGGEITMDQANASMYGGQMRIAEDLVTGLEKQGLNVADKGAERLPFGVGNLYHSKEYQRYQSGKDAFINSKLRRQSGATIRDDEYYREEKIYFPQPGDDAKRIEYKRALRQDAIKRMEQAAGPSYTRPPSMSDAPGGGGIVRWGRDASGNPVPLP